MYDQLNFKVISETFKEWKKHLIFLNFEVRNFTMKNGPKKNTLMFECYYSMDPIDEGVEIL